MLLNADGKFVDRLIPAMIAAALGVGGSAVVFWADSRATDREVAQSILNLKQELATVKDEQRDQRLAAAADRQRVAEIGGDVRALVRSTARIEALLDRTTPPRIP